MAVSINAGEDAILPLGCRNARENGPDIICANRITPSLPDSLHSPTRRKQPTAAKPIAHKVAIASGIRDGLSVVLIFLCLTLFMPLAVAQSKWDLIGGEGLTEKQIPTLAGLGPDFPMSQRAVA